MLSVKETQQYLVNQGFNPGPIDGIWGKRSQAAYDARVAEIVPKRLAAAKTQGFPIDRTASLVAFAGELSDIEEQLVRVTFPWACFYGSQRVGSCKIHEKVAASLARIFNELWDLSGRDQSIIDHWDISNYDGDYNNRPVSGGQRPSTHAFGLSIDLSAETNLNKHAYGRGRATMPDVVIDVFEMHGWKNGGRAWKRDFMHFQATL